MSINVTVSGNPISIQRGGKMIKDASSKQEFDKRRLIRLEQVRQQSKDIAENIRNKVKTDKSKRLSNVEKEGEIILQNWQAKKLLQLQNQYQEALDNIGLGHKQVDSIEEQDEIHMERLKKNEETFKERGRLAANKLQIENNERNLKKAIPIQRKKLTRDIENNRANNISNKKKSPIKKSKNSLQDSFDSDGENRIPKIFDISEENSSVSEIEEPRQSSKIIPTPVLKISKDQQTSKTLLEVPKSDKAAQTNLNVANPASSFSGDTRISQRIKRRSVLDSQKDYCNEVETTESKEQYHEIVDDDDALQLNDENVKCNCCQCPERPSSNKGQNFNYSAHRYSNDEVDKNKSQHGSHIQEEHEHFSLSKHSEIVGKNKHISDFDNEIAPRTKRGNELSQNVNLQEEFHDSSKPFSSRRIKDFSATQPRNVIESTTKHKTISEMSSKPKPIPSKPKITLRSSKNAPEIQQRGEKVQYYDHPNRFRKDYIPKQSQIEKINDEDLYSSPILSDEEMRQKKHQRNIDAHNRGQAAIEKEKMQREYRDLLRKLPLLQKQERIGEIGNDREKYHMSYDRLDDMNRKRQNRLDNAYEELTARSSKPVLVTVPTKKQNGTSLNLAEKHEDNQRTNELSSLLSKLKYQKSDLMKDIEKTLSHETVQQLSRMLSGEEVAKSSKRKRSSDENSSSTSSTQSSMKSASSSLLKSTAAAPSPQKKPKLKKDKEKATRKTLVLQNMSTQTTPTVVSPPATQQKNENTPEDAHDMCEIVIKLVDVDNSKPEVTVNPSSLAKNVRVITEEQLSSKVPVEILAKTKKRESKRTLKQQTSWRHELTNPSSTSTNSTAYYEPPDFMTSTLKSNKSKDTTGGSEALLEQQKTYSSNKQQREFSRGGSSSNNEEEIDPRLLTYMKKLLDMPRTNIDDLTVSGVSEVSTPSQSVVEMSTNNPMAQLKNVIKYFNLDPVQVQKQLAATSDTEETIASSVDKSSFFDVGSNQAKSRKLAEYADVAADCTRKISDLTAMIEKVRAEKKKMLETSPVQSEVSDKDYTTTSYLDLPDTKEKSADSSDELEKNLLGIDYSYAEKLKKLTPEEIEREKARPLSLSDEGLLTRLKALLTSLPAEVKQKEEFSPLLDIPKLPKFDQVNLTEVVARRKPPPSKGLKIFNNGDIPHELSTIVEGDSQMSTKLEQSPRSGASSVPDLLTEIPHSSSPTDKSAITTTNSSDEAMETMLQSIGMEWAIPTLKKTRQALAMNSSDSAASKKGDESESSASHSKNDVSLKEFLSKITSSSSNGSGILGESQEISIINQTALEDRKTSTPVQGTHLENIVRYGQPNFLQDSDLSSVKEHSHVTQREKSEDSSERFYDLNDNSTSKSKSR